MVQDPVDDYSACASQAIADRDATIPKDWLLPKSAYPLPNNVTALLSSKLSHAELAIVELPAYELRDKIAAGSLSAVDVTTAYLKAAAVAQQTVNCVVELIPDEALERARWLDQQLKSTGKTVGPLHGVPVSLKDHINLKGHDSPCGILSFVGNMVAKDDAHLVSILRDAGAIFHVKTTNPQSLMHLETCSYLGTTRCPYNPALTSGGSSGGEGATMGMKASALGVGTDIGGSVRSPAAANGVFAFKPSSRRLPYEGCNMPVGPAGWEGVLCTQGPFSRNARDLEEYMRVILDSKPWERDPTLHYRPWRELDTPKHLRIGIVRDDGVVAPVTPIRRALEDAVEKLSTSNGNTTFELVEYTLPSPEEAWKIVTSLYWPDAGDMVRSNLAAANEPVMELTDWILKEGGEKPTLEEALERIVTRDQWRSMLAKHWHDAGLDIVLAPVGPTPAPKHGTAKYWNYTSYWNLADYPAVVFPTGRFVDPSLDVHEPVRQPRNEKEAFVWGNYDAGTFAGAPIGLQLIGYQAHDEETLAALRAVLAALKA